MRRARSALPGTVQRVRFTGPLYIDLHSPKTRVVLATLAAALLLAASTVAFLTIVSPSRTSYASTCAAVRQLQNELVSLPTSPTTNPEALATKLRTAADTASRIGSQYPTYASRLEHVSSSLQELARHSDELVKFYANPTITTTVARSLDRLTTQVSALWPRFACTAALASPAPALTAVTQAVGSVGLYLATYHHLPTPAQVTQSLESTSTPLVNLSVTGSLGSLSNRAVVRVKVSVWGVPSVICVQVPTTTAEAPRLLSCPPPPV